MGTLIYKPISWISSKLKEHPIQIPHIQESTFVFERLCAGKNHLRVRALLIGDRLDLRTLKASEQLAAQPLTVPVDEQGCAVLYR